MNTMFKATQTVGEIVAAMPKASDIFKKHKIDFCCGGSRKLSEVIKEQKLDEALILEKLNEAYEESCRMGKGGRDFREMPGHELIDYIEATHHVYLRRVLPELDVLTTKIMRVHGMNHEVLFRVHKLFSMLKAELEQHLVKEEELLFPLITEHERKPDVQSLERVKQVMKEIEDEHEAAGDILKELRKITEDYDVPADGCNTYALTFNTLEEMEADLFQHIHLENNILFKKLA